MAARVLPEVPRAGWRSAPRSEARFDLAFCSNVLENLRDPIGALEPSERC